MQGALEELIAQCLRAYDENGDAGLRVVLEAHPAERSDLETLLDELRAVGLIGAGRYSPPHLSRPAGLRTAEPDQGRCEGGPK